MALAWRCSCGAEFTPQQNQLLTRHVKQGREAGEEHAGLGLVDTETGEVKAKVLRTATKLGLVAHSKAWLGNHPEEAARLARQDGGEQQVGASPDGRAEEPPVAPPAIRGRFVTQEVLLDGRLLVLYDLVRVTSPEYDGSLGEWIFDCIMQLYVEHSDEVGLDRLFENTLKVEVASDD